MIMNDKNNSNNNNERWVVNYNSIFNSHHHIFLVIIIWNIIELNIRTTHTNCDQFVIAFGKWVEWKS